jgi:glyoxylase-like metal-dependent hydrolase (beta-lactamase superfamily II)
MRRVVGTLHRLNRLTISNVFLVDGGPGDRWLVDTGHRLERWLILRELRRAGLLPRDLTGILLTHRHSDHAGNAAFFQARFGTRVYAHRADAGILDGSNTRPRLQPGGAWHPITAFFARLENRWPAPRVPIARALEAGDTLGGLEVHAAPGHTEGSVFYRHEGTASLFSGDMILTAHPPLTIRRGLCLAYPGFTSSMATARASLLAFHRAGIPYDNLLPGHGPPLLGRARERVLALVERTAETRG